MSELITDPLHKLCIQGVKSMWDTFYGIDTALHHHLQEWQNQPEPPINLPIDLTARLEQLRQHARQLERDIERAKEWFDHADHDEPRFEELAPEQVAGLKRLDEQLNGVMQHIRQTAHTIDATLAGPLADPANRLWDRNLNVEIRFHLREHGPAHPDDGDKLIAKVENSAHRFSADGPSFTGLDCTWPDGYDCTFPLPHGGLMHQLRLHGGEEMSQVDYRDLLRLGTVGVSIVAEHQYWYDLAQDKWTKGWRWQGDGPRQPVYVRDT
ncbi:MAG: hypothetical protein WCY08_16520 [Rhodocyclaceae bacterium]